MLRAWVVPLLVAAGSLGGAEVAAATPGEVSQPTVFNFVPTTAGTTNVFLVLTFVTPTTLVNNTDTVTVDAPPGTQFPTDHYYYAMGETGSTAGQIMGPVTVSPTGNSVTITVFEPVYVYTPGATVVIDINQVTNPPAGTYTMQISTSEDPTPVTTPPYVVTTATPPVVGNPPPPSTSTTTRIAGADRSATAIAASNAEYPAPHSAGAVVLARADDYPDALVGAPFAAKLGAPMLLTSGSTITASTLAEIQRVLAPGRTVYLLGGDAAIPPSVYRALAAAGYPSVRFAGSDRFVTALTVAYELGNPTTVLLATGTDFADALTAGPAAAKLHGAVLLTAGTTLPSGVQSYLAAHHGTTYAIGGPAAAADPQATPIVRSDRFATASQVAADLFPNPTGVGVASGTTFPDAVIGGAFEAHAGGPILLTDTAALPTSAAGYLTAGKNTIAAIDLFGGPSALSATVATAVQAALG